MRLRASSLFVLAALASGCAEGQYVEDDASGLGDLGDKDAKFVEELPEEDAKIPGEDAVAPEDVPVEVDTGVGDDASVAMDATTTDVVTSEDRPVVMDTGPVDTGVVDTGPVDTGVRDAGPMDTGPVDTGPVDTGVRDTGPVDTGPVDTGVIVTDTGPSYPPILCPLLGTPIPVTCRSRNGLPPCCGPGGICFCENRTPIGNFCLPCN